MSTMNRLLFSEQERKRREFRSAVALYVTVAVIVTTATHTAAFFIGDRMGYERGKAQEMNRPKPAPVVLQPASLISCDRSGLEEIARICKGRKRSEATHGR